MQKNRHPVPIPMDSVPGGSGCPKCGAAMESIEMGVEGLPIQQIQLCPRCYLVTWSDRAGFHFRQGVPMKDGVDPRRQPRSSAGEPQDC